jgi:hypothetical protein
MIDDPSVPPKRKLFRGQPLFGLIFILAGLGVLYMFGQTTQMTCTHTTTHQADCTLQIRALGLIPLRTAQVEGVRGARVTQSCSDSASNCTYRVELLQGRSSTPLTAFYSSGKSDKLALADRINSSLQDDSRKEFSAGVPLNWLIVLFSGVFVAAGIYAVFVPMRPGRGYPR